MTPISYLDPETAAKAIIDKIGKKIVIGIPLGIGKPIQFVNALYRLALADKSIQLTILTGLTLSRPELHNELEKRLVEPILERLLQDYEDPLYEIDRVAQKLPYNIKVIEFFLTPGKYIHNNYVQQNYISTNYTNAVRDIAYYGMNVVAQQVAPAPDHSDIYSLSCNSDLFHEATTQLRKITKDFAIVAEINSNLPYMLGEDALIKASEFTEIINPKRHRHIFAIPREELSAQDHMIGLYDSCLIKDNSCLQIGFGKLGNAVASALILRHKHNDLYQDCLNQLKINNKFTEEINLMGATSVFSKGLYASTEMLSDEYLQLLQQGILKKKVYDHIGLQRLLNENIISEDTDIPELLGRLLKNGKIIHAAFFVGSNAFYQQLRELPMEVLEQIDMTSVARTNALHLNHELFQLQRQHARFINSAMMITLSGVVISDGLKNFKEVSGVGGQFDFIYMANNLINARSIINCRSFREVGKRIHSNVLWEYSNFTIPRCFRDIIVTEYGIADCRSKTDVAIIKALLNITDSRFQKPLLNKAKKYGKLPQDYEIPVEYQQNLPEFFMPVVNELQLKGYCLPYPFGSDLTAEEEIIKQALLFLKNQNKLKLFFLIIKSFLTYNQDKKTIKYLARMKLDKPKNLKEFFYKKILNIGLYFSHS